MGYLAIRCSKKFFKGFIFNQKKCVQHRWEQVHKLPLNIPNVLDIFHYIFIFISSLNISNLLSICFIYSLVQYFPTAGPPLSQSPHLLSSPRSMALASSQKRAGLPRMSTELCIRMQ